MEYKELSMGPTGAMNLLKLGNGIPEMTPAGFGESGNSLHIKKGYGRGPIIRRRKYLEDLGVVLSSMGIPDEIDIEKGRVDEFKTYGERREIRYHVNRAIFQCCFYCWMLGFKKFNRFRILLYNKKKGIVDIIIEKTVDSCKFFKKLRKAVRLGLEAIESGQKKIPPRKKSKRYRECFWVLRFFEQSKI